MGTPVYKTTPAAYRLLHEGSIALAEVEKNGVRVDKGYLESTLASTAVQIKDYDAELRSDPIFDKWRRRFGEKTKLGAPDQLAAVVFGELGYEPRKGKTAGGKRDKADEAAFEHIQIPFVKLYFKRMKLAKARGTYLIGIQREMVERAGMWFVHPIYNLNRVMTQRSSADHPNWQNVPTRNEVMADIIRRCYIPLPGHRFVEIDYGQIEVKVAATYNGDPVWISYCRDPSKDMHRDMAMKLFFLDRVEGKEKKIRHIAKNKYVFPEMYGDYYVSCARSMWEAVELHDVRISPNETIFERLAANGVTSLGACDPEQRPQPGTFEHHVKAVEDWYWNEKYKVYTQWKKDWYAAYLRNGGVMMHTGFAVNGDYTRNEIINTGIQGSSFHCLLQSLTWKVADLRRLRMGARIVGEIHDCDVSSVPEREVDDYINLSKEIMTERLPREWKWITVPLSIEAEVTPIDGNWREKKEWIDNGGGKWMLKAA